jgi:hypothetical protein
MLHTLINSSQMIFWCFLPNTDLTSKLRTISTILGKPQAHEALTMPCHP